MPLRVTALVALVLTLVALGLADAVAGIPFVTYFWSALGITGAALLLGLVLRRTPWSLTPLLVVAALGTLAFGGSHASLHDGTGRQTWRPTSAPQQQYRLMFGRATLDLRALPPQATPRTVRVTVGAGEVRVLSSSDGSGRRHRERPHRHRHRAPALRRVGRRRHGHHAGRAARERRDRGARPGDRAPGRRPRGRGPPLDGSMGTCSTTSSAG